MMDLRYLLLIILALEILCVANGDNLVFQVERRKTTLSGIKHHDHHRRGRFLSSVDFNLGGNGLPTRTGSVSLLNFIIIINLITILSASNYVLSRKFNEYVFYRPKTVIES